MSPQSAHGMKIIVAHIPHPRLRPDGQRKWLSHSELVRLNEAEPLLSHMLEDATDRGWEIVYNPYHFQNEKDDSETCGRHVAVRLLNDGLSINQYKNLIKRSGLTPDEYVLEATRTVLGK